MKPSRVASLITTLLAVAACGGKGGGSKTPATAATDVCASGIHAAGMTIYADTWDALAIAASTTTDAMCQSDACGSEEEVSFVGAAPNGLVAVRSGNGWAAIEGVWDADEPAPQHRLSKLGDLQWLSLRFEELGRDDVELDDGTETTATVVIRERHLDFVIDPARGKVLWRAVCESEGDTGRATTLTRDGDTFAYTPCDAGATPVRFTTEQASACPSVSVDAP